MQLSAMAINSGELSMLVSATVVHTSVPVVQSFQTTLATWCAAVTRLNTVVQAALSLFTSSTPTLLSRPLLRAQLPLVLHQQTQARPPASLLAVFALPPTDRPLQIRTTSTTL